MISLSHIIEKKRIVSEVLGSSLTQYYRNEKNRLKKKAQGERKRYIRGNGALSRDFGHSAGV